MSDKRYRQMKIGISKPHWERLKVLAGAGTKPEMWATRILSRCIEFGDVEIGEPQTALEQKLTDKLIAERARQVRAKNMLAAAFN